jgi:hypothetical protein
MSYSKSDEGRLCSVDCAVAGCQYHGADDCCHADSISVESRGAIRKAETFCSTFTPRAVE